MVFFPVRKCYFLLKIALLIILVVTVLGLFEVWRGGKRKAAADQFEDEYERQILEDEARIIPGLGEGGEAAYLTGEDKKKGEESEKKLAMNVYLSDRIAYNRTLEDRRNPACARVKYDAELPSASVIIIFHNEPYSVVVRTIWSVINSCKRNNPWFQTQTNFIDSSGRKMNLGYPGQDPNSALVYLKEIILVDDNSTLPELKGKLSHYVRTRLPPDLIRILRLPDRVGLTRARVSGARYATGSTLVFLDAHCEGQRDWLRPLLQAIRKEPHAVTVPIIDSIDDDSFYYSVQDGNDFQVGGFTFTGHFTWIDVPEREKIRRGSDISPTWSPTMAGGLFAIDRSYYWELGAYDEQMAGWGGENLEMSFRIWQCGGTLETVPCSRVGHVFRSFHPYSLPANSDTHGINTARMAEVWMDEYAELFYLHRPDLRHNPTKIGDVTHRKILREKLQCKSFKWFLDNIYKEKYVPVRDSYGYGRFRNPSANLCLDTLQREGGDTPLGVYSCHPDLQATQYFSLSLLHELRDEENCAQLQYQRDGEEKANKPRKLLMSSCRGHASERKWRYNSDTKQIQHTDLPLCLDAGYTSGADVLAKPCSEARSQKWEIDYSEDNDFQMTNEVDTSDQAFRLQRLRGQRRRSRSLLSVTEETRRRFKKHHKRTKKNKAKNKFILKLVRTLMNNTEEHLEVDIYCKHRQLYPNNTFVRDIVTILNERNIKVINNGRLFERNKVTQLDPKMLEYDDGKVLNKMDIAPDTLAEESKKHQHKAQGNIIPTIPKEREEKETGEAVSSPLGSLLEPEVERQGKGRGAGRGGAHSATSPKAHRIIVEDFVVMTPSYPGESKSKSHRKRKRKRTTTPMPPVTEDDNLVQKAAPEDEINVPLQSEEKVDSMEDTPMVYTENRAMDKPSEERLTPNKPSDESPTPNKHSEESPAPNKHSEESPAPNKHSEERLDQNKHSDERRVQKHKHRERSKERALELEGNEESDIERTQDLEMNQEKERSQEKKRTKTVKKPSAKEKQKELAELHEAENWGHGESIYVRHRSDPRRRQKVKSKGREHGHSDSEKATQSGRETGKGNSDSERHGDYETKGYKLNELQDNAIGESHQSHGRTPAPVKVVMRSNLTFNLGEEFFKWRAARSRAAVHTDEPTPPSARTPDIKAWIYGSDVTSPRMPEAEMDDDVIYFSRPHAREREKESKAPKETEESSGSSESASE